MDSDQCMNEGAQPNFFYYFSKKNKDKSAEEKLLDENKELKRRIIDL